jgi:hypothetical protein
MKVHLFAIILMAGCVAKADTMTMRDGAVVAGDFQGFSARQFQMKTAEGVVRAEYAADVQSIVLDAPEKASATFIVKQYDAVVFSRFDHNMIRFRKDGVLVSEPVIMLKSLDIQGPVNPPPLPAVAPASAGGADPATSTRIVAPGKVPQARDWKRTGKWREVEEDKSTIISHGEVVDIDSVLHKGVVNVVHFHYPQAVGSIREGNYLQGIMARHPNRLVVLKVVAQDFRAPICESLNLKTLPQFWFYSADGRLVKKLTDRFTEGDIDAALKDAGRR